MATTALTAETFESTITDSDVLFVDFWASWCGPCMRFGPTYEATSEKHPDAVFAKVDTEDQQELAAALEIQSIPTIMAFRNGHLVFRQPGALNAAQLNSLVEQVKALDPAELEKQAAAQRDQQDA